MIFPLHKVLLSQTLNNKGIFEKKFKEYVYKFKFSLKGIRKKKSKTMFINFLKA